MTNTPITDALADRRRLLGFTTGYWLLNTIEMFERLSYYLVRSVVAIYIMQADDPHGLHFTAADKGTIYALWFVFQSILPTFTGGFADRYGYKRSLFLAITGNVLGYCLMATQHSFLGFTFGVVVLATGTAFFKPALQGSLAQNLNRSNSSLGWGIFYWVVNVGAAIGPMLANFIRHDYSWQALFFTAAAVMSLNYLMLFTFKDFASGSDKTANPRQVLTRTLRTLGDWRLATWLLIMSCFWLMMYTLWDLHPNFLTDWNDSGGTAAFFRGSSLLPGQLGHPDRPRLAGAAGDPAEPQRGADRAADDPGLVARAQAAHAGVDGHRHGHGHRRRAGGRSDQPGLGVPAGRGRLLLRRDADRAQEERVPGADRAGGQEGSLPGLREHPGGRRRTGRLQAAGLLLRTLRREGGAGAEVPGGARPGAGRLGRRARHAATRRPACARTEAFVRLQQVTGLDPAAATDLLWRTYDPAAKGVAAVRGDRRGGDRGAGVLCAGGAEVGGHGCLRAALIVPDR